MAQINILPNSRLQSPHLILQAAGSTGNDGSIEGVHLRWTFNGALGKNHLPKGNLADSDSYTNPNSYNKANDYVKIYRAHYNSNRQQVSLNFSNSPNQIIETGGVPVWVYKKQSYGGREQCFHVKFIDTDIYNFIINNGANPINPNTYPMEFMKAYCSGQYGNGLIEIRSVQELFFAVDCDVYTDFYHNFTPNLETEILTEAQTYSVDEKNNKTSWTTRQYVSSRATEKCKNYYNNVQFLCENGRTFRFRVRNGEAFVDTIRFEFYVDIFSHINSKGEWALMGEYALSLDWDEVVERLAPDDIVDSWPRYNAPDYVDAKIYMDRWSGLGSNLNEKYIKDVVEEYINLSNDPENPSGIENLSGDVRDRAVEMPLVDVLNVGAMDFHVARMLGLGTIDTEIVNLNNYFDYGYYSAYYYWPNTYIYVAEYISVGNLDEEYINGAPVATDTVQHLFMSLPTSPTDERLPLPVEIAEIIPGIANNPGSERVSSVTDSEGYTFDGLSRHVTLIAKPEIEIKSDIPFYESDIEFSLAESSLSVYAGVRYKKSGSSNYTELSSSFYELFWAPQTIPLIVPEDTRVLYIHRQKESGTHEYKSYGVNIFSRAVSDQAVHSIQTELKPANLLQPPGNTKAHIIREESPLFLTSQEEQTRYSQISGNDKTLIRVSFDFNAANERFTYKIGDEYHFVDDATIVAGGNTTTGELYFENTEIFASQFEIFFRNHPPAHTQGKAILVEDSVQNPLISKITVTNYELGSINKTLIPELLSKYIGGLFLMGDQQFIIHSLESNCIYVFKNVQDGKLFIGEREEEEEEVEEEEEEESKPPLVIEDDLQAPVLTEDGLFMMIENMQTVGNWSANSTPVKNVNIDLQNIHREVFYKTTLDEIDESIGVIGNAITERYIDKTRGFMETATIEFFLEDIEIPGTGAIWKGHKGLYKLTFLNFNLPAHPQSNFVEYYKGVVRLKRESAYNQKNTDDNTDPVNGFGERSTFEVVAMDTNSSGKLILYIYDSDFSRKLGDLSVNEKMDDPGTGTNESDFNGEIADFVYTDPIKTGTQVVNYQPGYKVYLYADGDVLSENSILPADQEENVRYSIAGLRSCYIDNFNNKYFSKFSAPALMFAQHLVPPLQPERPEGIADYATRPDSFGKSTYTFTTQFEHIPHSILFARSSDGALLKLLYDDYTVKAVKGELDSLAHEYLIASWDAFFDIESFKNENEFLTVTGGYKFPLPNSQLFLNIINDPIKDYNKTQESSSQIPLIIEITSLQQVVIAGLKIIDFIKHIIDSSFVPLTEIPILYQHIKSGDYSPQPRKQNIKDRDGHLLLPTNPAFDMAPMAKVLTPGSSNPKVLFTDFTLDGTLDDVYFYRVMEMDSQMKMSAFSDFLGPVKLVNTNPPEAPEIRKIMPILENRILDIAPAVQFEINAYQSLQRIRKITVYRTTDRLNAQSVRTMDRIKEILLAQENMLEQEVWTFEDDFSDLTEIPYGVTLYYRITASREVTYLEGSNPVTEYVPSKPSKILATLVVESSAPESPELEYSATNLIGNQLINVVLSWNKTVHNGKYHIYQMNPQGNWRQIGEVSSDMLTFTLDSLDVFDEEENPIYNHFKVLAENSSGMISTEENILTISQDSEVPSRIFDYTFDYTFE